MTSTIGNAKDRPITFPSGTVPDMNAALRDFYQPLQFTQVLKTVVGFQVVETPTTTSFRGLIQPFTPRQLLLKPEGERAWTWFTVFSDPVLTLQADDVITFLSKQTRVMSRRDYALYGYLHYELVQDFTGSGP